MSTSIDSAYRTTLSFQDIHRLLPKMKAVLQPLAIEKTCQEHAKRLVQELDFLILEHAGFIPECNPELAWHEPFFDLPKGERVDFSKIDVQHMYQEVRQQAEHKDLNQTYDMQLYLAPYPSLEEKQSEQPYTFLIKFTTNFKTFESSIHDYLTSLGLESFDYQNSTDTLPQGVSPQASETRREIWDHVFEHAFSWRDVGWKHEVFSLPPHYMDEFDFSAYQPPLEVRRDTMWKRLRMMELMEAIEQEHPTLKMKARRQLFEAMDRFQQEQPMDDPRHALLTSAMVPSYPEQAFSPGPTLHELYEHVRLTLLSNPEHVRLGTTTFKKRL